MVPVTLEPQEIAPRFGLPPPLGGAAGGAAGGGVGRFVPPGWVGFRVPELGQLAPSSLTVAESPSTETTVTVSEPRPVNVPPAVMALMNFVFAREPSWLWICKLSRYAVRTLLPSQSLGDLKLRR